MLSFDAKHDGYKFSADDILKYFSFFFLENKNWYFIQGDNFHELSDPIFWEK